VESVNESSSCKISFEITDENDVAVQKASIATATLSIFDYDSGTVVLPTVDIYSDISASGTVSYHINGQYNNIINQGNMTEKRVVYVMISGVGAGSPEIRHEYHYDVNNMFKIT
jgi:hypothetical protein